MSEDAHALPVVEAINRSHRVPYLTCSKCSATKAIDLFPATGLVCKTCRNFLAIQKTPKQREMARIRANRWAKNNRKQINAYGRQHYRKNIKRIALYAQQYQKNNRAKINAYASKYSASRIKRDPVFKFKVRTRQRILIALRGLDNAKRFRTAELIGTSIAGLRAHLESLWKPGMSWGNHALRGWHVDHIKPCSKFDLTDPQQQKACFHYTNLQPLWWRENIIKSDKY